MARRRLPIGIQTFRELREQDCYYVDKTAYVERLLREGKHYFLSRPRRFGKSLFLDTLKELFEGSEELFVGLHIHAGHDWSQRHPVVRLSFGGGSFTGPDALEANVMEQLAAAERRLGVESEYLTAAGRFAYLLEALHRQTGQRVAVLVDEYDKPILDVLEDRETARANRDYLRGLYGVIKDNDAHVRFTFLTGISKFSKVNRPRYFRGSFSGGRTGWATGEADGAAGGALFSQLNNLTDLTLDPPYSSVCGYTEQDLDTVFAPEMAGLDREQVREWYNGYSWRGAEKVYNPYDVLLLLRRGEFAAHWFETGTPAFLVDTLFERRVSSVALDDMMSPAELLSAFDVGGRAAADHIGTEALLFQTGYLTIAGEERLGGKALYRLGYPNREVRQSLNEHLLRHLVQDSDRQTANSIRLARLLEAHDCAGLKELFGAFFASIPYQWYTNNAIADYEGFYASVFYSYFAALGYDIAVEESTSHGRLDMAVRAAGHVYLFEFKVAEMAPPGSALAQLRERGYADKYRARGEPIHLVGVEFSRATRNVTAFEAADA
ncbi:MAG: ATP-binding protein [Spirochaetaceae bacterium]|nr:ATP-binding protein [Spirochaetaceae bacterium]